ncbi:MAG: DUF4197 domain-containing protein [Flavobacteriales bacterium]|jgi:hypothetical protein|nr:DUF4197 domain-containing protein [Flavobacteriales bacterium]MBP6641644.1 DUF4197 domain-containing protein [Flavobacteriales bacterium]MBP7155714.1 DUF4197 domain-containing protein [Flavobacteriales bacterium]HQV75019.1 DUF4197 domain-containing protein [Flavobacteriales bacterium]HQW40070.1 DUF4197 domain-containing protein [Flavobacteriales bacterium]
MKHLIALAILLSVTNLASAQFPKSLKDAASKVTSGGGVSGLSNDEVIAGLKEALVKGAEGSVLKGSALDGFWKNDLVRIPFPPEAEKMKNTLNSIGMTKQVEEFELTMNRAAEEAAKEALPILKSAVTGMSVGDGFAILKGGDNAATNYLSEKTTASLTERFSPIVKKATETVALTNYWTPLANGYNKASKFTGGKAVDPDLDAYVTQKAIEGLFKLVAQEEAKIRQDPMARTSDLLKRVFGGG